MGLPWDFLYRGDFDPLDEPGYVPPEVFQSGEWYLVATFAKDPPDGDGQPCEVYECRYPCSFWRVKGLGDTNGIGMPVEPFDLCTGSGDDMGHLVFAMARAAAQGMIGVYKERC